MNLGQVTTAIEFQVTNHTDTVFDNRYNLEDHLNEMGKAGWYLHTITSQLHKDVDGYDVSTMYHCIWQKITQNVSGLLK